MSNWDDEEDDEPVKTAAPSTAPKKSKYADEDAAEEEVKDDWENSDEEEAAPVKPAGPAPPVRAKGITKQKIAEREEAERVREENIAARNDNDPVARKLKERDAMIASDMDNAAMLLGNTTVKDYVDPFAMKCKTLDDFKAFSGLLSAMIIAKHGTNPFYAAFILQFMRDVCEPLRDVDTRKTASAITVLANEKQTAAKDALAGSKKKSKGAARPGLNGKSVGCGRAADVGTYEEALDDSGDYDDFM